MLYNKLVVSCKWVAEEHKLQPKWRLLVCPHVEVYATTNNKLVPLRSFLLLSTENTPNNYWFDAEHMSITGLNIEPDGQSRVQLHNLGYIDDDGYEYDLYVRIDNAISEKKGLDFFLDEIELDKDDDQLDREIITRLKMLKAPLVITFTSTDKRTIYVN